MRKKKKKGKNKKISPIPVTTVSKTFKTYLEKDKNGNTITQVEPEGLENLRDTLVEFTKIVAIESEKLAITKGSKRITARDIHDATVTFFGGVL